MNETKNDDTIDKIDALASNSLLLSMPGHLDHADPMSGPFTPGGEAGGVSALAHDYDSDGNDEDVDVDEPLEMDYGSDSSEDDVHGLIDDDGQSNSNSNVRVLSRRTDGEIGSTLLRRFCVSGVSNTTSFSAFKTWWTHSVTTSLICRTQKTHFLRTCGKLRYFRAASTTQRTATPTRTNQPTPT